jgi:hypothetical protein
MLAGASRWAVMLHSVSIAGEKRVISQVDDV